MFWRDTTAKRRAPENHSRTLRDCSALLDKMQNNCRWPENLSALNLGTAQSLLNRVHASRSLTCAFGASNRDFGIGNDGLGFFD